MQCSSAPRTAKATTIATTTPSDDEGSFVPLRRPTDCKMALLLTISADDNRLCCS